MITLFTPSFADEANSNAQNLSVKEIVARLDPEKIAVTMLHEGAVDPRIAVRPNITLISWRKHGNTLQTAWKILRNVPDVYFFPREGPLDAVFFALRRHLKISTAVVTYIVSGGLHSQSYAPARVRNIREADAVFANNNYLAQLLKAKMDVDAGIMYDGIDRRYYYLSNTAKDSQGTLSVLYAGSLRPYKRVPLVVQQAVRWPQVRFRIAGTGEEEEKCRALASQHKCANVEFLGHLSAARLGDEMRRADIFFFPSALEGHPQVLGQAAACGLPAIAMKIYRPDYVVDGVTGFLVEPDDELSKKLEMLIRQPELRRTMGEAAAVHAQKFDWDMIARQWQDAFESTATLRRKR